MDMQSLLDQWLQKGLTLGCYPGATAACGRGKEVWALSSVGETEPGKGAVNLETRYDMASLTKLLAPTMIALRAIEDGELTLWDTLGYWFGDVPEDKREITVFQLMTHTAGFEPSFRLDKVCAAREEALGAILNSKLIAKPGAEPNYSCMGYITLGKVLEKLYGRDLNALSRERVFGPLGMDRTGYLPEGGNIASTELDAATGKCLNGVVHDENARFLGGISANAGVFSDIGDMTRFCGMLAVGGDGFLTKAMLEKATHNYTPGFDTHRGLGFHLAGTEYNYAGDLFPECSFGHTGLTGTTAIIDPSTGFYVVLLANRVCPSRKSEALFRFRRAMHNALYAAFQRKL